MIGNGQNGNILFLILIAVVLFASLSYAVTNTSRSGNVDLSKEKAQLSGAVGDSCTASVNGGILLLKARSCSETEISYEQPDGTNPNPAAPPNKSCHIFHPAGAGIAPCGGYITGDDPCMSNLAIGESCNNVIYVGISGGNRLYTTKTDSGAIKWGQAGYDHLGATSTSDGLANTNTILANTGIGAPFEAAAACRSLGPKWYLPATSELNLMYTNRNTGELSGSFSLAKYWSSREFQNANIFSFDFSNNSIPTHWRTAVLRVRCVRRD